MARMLGRVETPGCCPGSRSGWNRRRHRHGPDCSGAATDTRWAKRIEQRQFQRELLPEGELDVPADVWRDCRHGCDGECLLHSGPSECGLTCHPGRVWPRYADGLLADEGLRDRVVALWPEDWGQRL